MWGMEKRQGRVNESLVLVLLMVVGMMMLMMIMGA
jgi:hypothetical protein